MPTVYIIIYSLYHHIYKVAKSVQKGLESQGVTVKIYQVAETLKDDVLEKLHAPAKPDVPVITVDDLTHADGFLFGIPTRFGTLPAQFKTFLDATGGLWASNALAGKFVGTFFSTASQNGGQDTTAFTLIPYFTHLGMMYVSLGAGHINLFDNSEVVGGSPFGAGTVANGDGSREPTEKELAIAVTQGENYAKIITTYHRGLERQETENKLKNDSPVVSNTQPITEERSMQQEQDPVTAQQESSSEVPVQVVEVPAQAVEAPAQAVEAPAQAVEVPAQEITDTVHPTEHVVRPAETSPIQDISTTDEIRPSDEFQPAKVEKLPSEVTSQPPIAEEPVQEKPAVKAGEKKDRKLEKKEKKHKKCFCAGHLSRTKEPHYKSLCAMACEKAMELLKQNKPALEAVTAAIRVLEDDPLTNAGWGSNLTIEGTVECDASLMDGDGYFGAVGAVSGLKNPVVATRCMLEESKQGLLSLGRIPPMLLVGEGAKRWAEARGCETVESFVEPSSYRVYQDHKKRLKEFEQSIDLGHDTVGAICIDGQGNIASGVSSGGISLKQPGRVGEAAMYGCGCWAQNETEDEPGIACSTSGTGEQIMKTMLTYKCAERLKTELDSAMKNTLQKDFLDSPFLKDYDIKSAGIIALRAQKSHHKTRVELWYGHVTKDMGIGYMSGTSNKPKSFISRRPSTESMVTSGQLIV